LIVDPRTSDTRDDWSYPTTVFEVDNFKAAVALLYGNEVGVGDAADIALAEYVRRWMVNASSIVDGLGRAKMYDIRQILAALEISTDEETTLKILDRLEEDSFVSFDSPPFDVPEPYAFANLNSSGYERGLALLNRLSERVLNEIPASDRLVDLGHNRSDVQDAIQKLEDASEVVRKSNSMQSDEKGAIRDQIALGIELLRKPKVYATAVTALLLKPLYDAYAGIAEESYKVILQAAIAAVRNLIGL
tara:strand:- start:111 stop:851 length:741 start_codon:yes stop_codon:yes gene_type:complete